MRASRTRLLPSSMIALTGDWKQAYRGKEQLGRSVLKYAERNWKERARTILMAAREDHERGSV